MSFICANCSKPALHGVSPSIVCGTHPHTHMREGELIEQGRGPQITFEEKLCPDCSGKPTTKAAPADFSVLRAFAQGFARTHARGCDGTKKIKRAGRETQVIACQTCIDIQKTFASMPAPGLSFALEDAMAPPLKVSLAFLCVGGLTTQSERKGKKAARDFAASYGVLKPYEARGNGF